MRRDPEAPAPSGVHGIGSRGAQRARKYTGRVGAMLVAVTGGTGFIGSHTVRALTERGHRVRLLVRDPAKAKRVFDASGTEIDETVIGDARDEGVVARLLDGCDALVHAAALVALDAARGDEVLGNNERIVRGMVGGAVERGISRIVYVSSGGALFVAGGAPLSGHSPVIDSEGAYAQSKAAGERFVRELQDAGAPIHTTYPTAAIGPDDPGLTDPNRAVSFFVRYGALLTSSGYQPIDVRDLAALHVALLECDEPRGRHVAAGPFYPWKDLYACVERVTGRRLFRYPIPGAIMRALGRGFDALLHVARLPLPIPITREAMEFATQWPGADGDSPRAALGLEYRSLDETLRDTYRWLLDAGHVTPRQVGRLASPGS